MIRRVIHPFIRFLMRTFDLHGESATFTARYRVAKYRSGWPSVPYEVTGWTEPNKVVNTGLSHVIKLITGESALTLNNANARLGSGDNSTAEAAGQTNLQAATNKIWVAMDATYPTAESNRKTRFQATFAAGVATWTWLEDGFARGDPGSGGIMAGRKVVNHGAKGAGDSWILFCDLEAMSAT